VRPEPKTKHSGCFAAHPADSSLRSFTIFLPPIFHFFAYLISDFIFVSFCIERTLTCRVTRIGYQLWIVHARFQRCRRSQFSSNEHQQQYRHTRTITNANSNDNTNVTRTPNSNANADTNFSTSFAFASISELESDWPQRTRLTSTSLCPHRTRADYIMRCCGPSSADVFCSYRAKDVVRFH
jgi:hypothetical protein